MIGPVFILGAHKSGTSLLRAILDGHKSLIVNPIESHFFEHLGLESLLSLRKYAQKDLNFKDSILNLLNEYNSDKSRFSDLEAYDEIDVSAARRFLETANMSSLDSKYKALIHAIFIGFRMDIRNDLTLVDKSIDYHQFAVALRMIFPSCKFIHVIRNPYANLVALRKFKTFGPFPSLPELIHDLSLSYYFQRHNSRILHGYFTLRFEDLISDSSRIVDEICDFLGIERIQSIHPTSRGEMWKGNSSSGESFDKISIQPLTNWFESISPIEKVLVEIHLAEYLEIWDYSCPVHVGNEWRPNKGETFRTYFRNRIYKYLKI